MSFCKLPVVHLLHQWDMSHVTKRKYSCTCFNCVTSSNDHLSLFWTKCHCNIPIIIRIIMELFSANIRIKSEQKSSADGWNNAKKLTRICSIKKIGFRWWRNEAMFTLTADQQSAAKTGPITAFTLNKMAPWHQHCHHKSKLNKMSL